MGRINKIAEIKKNSKKCEKCNLWKPPMEFPVEGIVCLKCNKVDDTHVSSKTRALESKREGDKNNELQDIGK